MGNHGCEMPERFRVSRAEHDGASWCMPPRRNWSDSIKDGEKPVSMKIRAVSDLDRSQKLMVEWIMGSILESFSFGGGFVLNFCVDGERTFEGNKLPANFELHLVDDWWFGDEKEWEEKIKSLGSGIEPDLPVKGHCLTELCWSKEGVIVNATVDRSGLTICFENGMTLRTRTRRDEEYTFWLSDFGTWASDGDWSIVQDFDETYVRTPPKQEEASLSV